MNYTYRLALVNDEVQVIAKRDGAQWVDLMQELGARPTSEEVFTTEAAAAAELTATCRTTGGFLEAGQKL